MVHQYAEAARIPKEFWNSPTTLYVMDFTLDKVLFVYDQYAEGIRYPTHTGNLPFHLACRGLP